jgi:hypothetical protein
MALARATRADRRNANPQPYPPLEKKNESDFFSSNASCELLVKVLSQ